MEETSDWRDGFLFVGNHLALDFLNTRPVVNGEPAELLDSWSSVVRWAVAAGLADSPHQTHLSRSLCAESGAEQELAELKVFREAFRAAILATEKDQRLPGKFVRRLNDLLRIHPMYTELASDGSQLAPARRFVWKTAGDFYAPLVEAIAALLANEDLARVRKCRSETCVLHFYDTSKNRTRNWCSMQTCGNRAKVGAYASRKRLADVRNC